MVLPLFSVVLYSFHCNESVSRGGRSPKTYGTINLLKHLRCNHKSDFSALQEEEAAQVKEKGKTSASGTQATLDDYVQLVTPLAFNHPTAWKITRSIADCSQ